MHKTLGSLPKRKVCKKFSSAAPLRTLQQVWGDGVFRDQKVPTRILPQGTCRSLRHRLLLSQQIQNHLELHSPSVRHAASLLVPRYQCRDGKSLKDFYGWGEPPRLLSIWPEVRIRLQAVVEAPVSPGIGYRDVRTERSCAFVTTSLLNAGCSGDLGEQIFFPLAL